MSDKLVELKSKLDGLGDSQEAVPVWIEYAALLRQAGRKLDAANAEARAKVLQSENEYVDCPRCGESFQRKAKTCCFCKVDLTAPVPKAEAAPAICVETPEEEKQKRRQRINRIGIACWIVAPFVLAGISLLASSIQNACKQPTRSSVSAEAGLPDGWQFYKVEVPNFESQYELVCTKAPYADGETEYRNGCQGVLPDINQSVVKDGRVTFLPGVVKWCKEIPAAHLKMYGTAVKASEVPEAWREALCNEAKKSRYWTFQTQASSRAESASQFVVGKDYYLQDLKDLGALPIFIDPDAIKLYQECMRINDYHGIEELESSYKIVVCVKGDRVKVLSEPEGAFVKVRVESSNLSPMSPVGDHPAGWTDVSFLKIPQNKPTE